MPKLSRTLVFFAIFLFAVIARSQGSVVTSAQTGNAVGSASGAVQNPEPVHASIGVVAGFGGIAGVGMNGIKGQPFSADMIGETDLYLADGNHIHRESHGKIYRDSEGRSRTESEIGGTIAGSKPFVHITIFDPPNHVFIMLDPQNKTANVHHLAERPGQATFQAPPRPAQPGPASQHGLNPSAPMTQARIQGAQKVQGPQIESQRSREDLGTMEIEGFTVKGTRFTITTPAGAMGNDKPMTSITERWFSEELKMDLVTKSNSPESGERVQRLVNIRSGDPDPLLFQTPADYTVKEQQ